MQPASNYLRFVWNKTGIIISLVFLFILTTYTFGPSPTDTYEAIKSFAPTRIPDAGAPKHWHGWDHITHMIVFGDSYTTTGFRSDRAPPSELNPLGNPDYPGDTSSNGPNWIDFLTTTYNQTFLKTVNFAYGGATVDGDLIAQFVPMIHSFKHQVHGDYVPNYASPPATFDWEADNTLFASFFGINDVNNAWRDATAERSAEDVLCQDMAEYANLIDLIYQSGARNFLFMLVPPFDRSPLVMLKGDKAVREEGKLIHDFNANLTAMANNFTNTYSDVTTFIFDTHKIYTQVLDDPCSHQESCAVQNTTEFCPEYQGGTLDWHSFKRECAVSVDRYFWLNPLHPTFRVQNVTAKTVAEQLSGKDSFKTTSTITPEVVGHDFEDKTEQEYAAQPSESSRAYRR